MNIETLDFQELLTEQQNSPQQTSMEPEDLIKDVLNSNEEKVEIQEETKEEPKEESQQKEERQTLYPLGTVVMLKGGKKRLMVVGFDPLNETRTNKAYDYIGCLFPEGILATDKLAMFNHDQIEKVYLEGLSDDEEKEFKEKLEDFFDTLK